MEQTNIQELQNTMNAINHLIDDREYGLSTWRHAFATELKKLKSVTEDILENGPEFNHDS